MLDRPKEWYAKRKSNVWRQIQKTQLIVYLLFDEFDIESVSNKDPERVSWREFLDCSNALDLFPYLC